MSDNTSSPEERVSQMMVDGMLKGIDSAGAFLRQEIRKEVLKEVRAEYAGRDRALKGVIAAIERKQQQSDSRFERAVMDGLSEEIRTVVELWTPGLGFSRLYDICERCNFDNHICTGCGEELTHLGEKVHNAGPGPKCHE